MTAHGFIVGALLAWLGAYEPVTETRAATESPPASAVPDIARSAAARTADSGIILVCFEPDEDCIGLMSQEIDRARDEILIMAFLFSNRRIIRAVNRARDRGVRVSMVVSSGREGAGRVLAVQRRGVEVLTQDGLTQHSKYLIIDRRIVITGSQNFTASSESNAENTLAIDDPRTVAAYVRNWERRAAASRPARDTPRPPPADQED